MHVWTILIVNPQKKDHQVFKRLLSDVCDIRIASTSSEAIEILSNEAITLVFSAHQLVDVSGFEFLNCLKENFPHMPAVITARNPDKDLILAAFRHEALDFVEMPCEKQELEDIIRKAVRNRQIMVDKPAPTAFPEERFRGVISSFWEALRSDDNAPGQNDESAKNAILEIPDMPGMEIRDASPKEASYDFRVFFLGRFRIEAGNRQIDEWPGHKGKQLLAYLLSNRKRHIHREQLMNMFWPESTLSCAKNSLNVALCGLRKLFSNLDFGKDFIRFRNDCYFINPDLDIWVDTEAFRRHSHRGQSLDHLGNISEMISEYQAATALYKGDFIEEDRYDDWSSIERENLLETYLLILSRLSYFYSINGKPRTAITLCDRVLGRDQCREDIHRRLMFCYYRIGQRNRSIRQYQKCRKILDYELGVEPTRATVSLYERICNGEHLDVPDEEGEESTFDLN